MAIPKAKNQKPITFDNRAKFIEYLCALCSSPKIDGIYKMLDAAIIDTCDKYIIEFVRAKQKTIIGNCETIAGIFDYDLFTWGFKYTLGDGLTLHYDACSCVGLLVDNYNDYGLTVYFRLIEPE